MADENSDITEIVGYETDEGDEGVLENPVAPKKLEVSEWKLIRSNNEILTSVLQQNSAIAETAVNVLNYLNLLSCNLQFLKEPIKSVIQKLLSNNDVAKALLHQRPRFFEYMENIMRPSNSVTAGEIFFSMFTFFVYY